MHSYVRANQSGEVDAANYLWWLLREVDVAVRLGLTADAAMEALPLDKKFMESRLSPAARVNPLLRNSLECVVDVSGR
jgi:hypothetical protein